MTPRAFEIAQQAMTSILFYRRHYASGQKFQERFQEMLSMLRAAGEASSSENYGDKKFLNLFADTLELTNKAGEYVPLSTRRGDGDAS
jgi:hypothetical protein